MLSSSCFKRTRRHPKTTGTKNSRVVLFIHTSVSLGAANVLTGPLIRITTLVTVNTNRPLDSSSPPTSINQIIINAIVTICSNPGLSIPALHWQLLRNWGRGHRIAWRCGNRIAVYITIPAEGDWRVAERAAWHGAGQREQAGSMCEEGYTRCPTSKSLRIEEFAEAIDILFPRKRSQTSKKIIQPVSVSQSPSNNKKR